MSRIFMLILGNPVIHNPGMQMRKKEQTQSIAISAEEKQAIEVIALAARVKPATLARHLLYRGIYQFLKDGEVYEGVTDEDIYRALEHYIQQDENLSRIKEMVRMRGELAQAKPLLSSKRATANEGAEVEQHHLGPFDEGFRESIERAPGFTKEDPRPNHLYDAIAGTPKAAKGGAKKAAKKGGKGKGEK
jgi:hypothetical protein